MNLFSLGPSRLVLLIVFVAVLLHASESNSKEWIAGFITTKNGTIYQVNVVSLGKTLSLTRTFPMDDSNRGIQLTSYPGGEKYLKLEPRHMGLLWKAHAIGSDRIAVHFPSDYGIWDIETNQFSAYRNGPYSWSPLSDRIKELSKEMPMLSNQGEAISGDGMKYAVAYKKAPEFTRCHMTILSQSTLQTSRYEFPEDVCPLNMAWSPTGEYLASVTYHGRVLKHELNIWNYAGRLVYTSPVPTDIEQDWAPVWKASDPVVKVFYRGDGKILFDEHTLKSIDP